MKRVAFHFDDRCFAHLLLLKCNGQFATVGEAVRDALIIYRRLLDQAAQGFTEILVRNPTTGDERVLHVRRPKNPLGQR